MKKLSVLMFLSLMLAACQSAGPAGNQGGEEVEKQKLHQPEEVATVIDWVDFIQFEGKHYVAVDSAVLTEESGIGGKAGAVEFKVADNVDDPYYQIKNGDAAFWKKGTALFRVKEMPEFLAVADESEVNGYRLYLSEGVEEEFPHHFKDVDLEKVDLVEIYTAAGEPEMLNRINGENLEAFKALLLEGIEPPASGGNAGPYDPAIYQMIFYSGEPFAHAFHIYNEGGQWLWYPWDEQHLPEGIGPFVMPET